MCVFTETDDAGYDDGDEQQVAAVYVEVVIAIHMDTKLRRWSKTTDYHNTAHTHIRTL